MGSCGCDGEHLTLPRARRHLLRLVQDNNSATAVARIQCLGDGVPQTAPGGRFSCWRRCVSEVGAVQAQQRMRASGQRLRHGDRCGGLANACRAHDVQQQGLWPGGRAPLIRGPLPHGGNQIANRRVLLRQMRSQGRLHRGSRISRPRAHGTGGPLKIGQPARRSQVRGRTDAATGDHHRE